MARPLAWTSFDAEQLAAIARGLPPLGERADAQPCPSCDSPTLRWYSYLNPFRSRSKITYVWCSSCRYYYGETTLSPSWDLRDPFEGATPDDRLAMEHDLDSFFKTLDDLWSSGELPQVRGAEGLRLLRGDL